MSLTRLAGHFVIASFLFSLTCCNRQSTKDEQSMMPRRNTVVRTSRGQENQDKLRGSWIGVRDDDELTVTLTFGPGNSISLRAKRNDGDEESAEGEYHVDWSKRPAHMDIDLKGHGKIRTIVELLDEDHLSFENVEPGADRPARLTSDALTFERAGSAPTEKQNNRIRAEASDHRTREDLVNEYVELCALARDLDKQHKEDKAIEAAHRVVEMQRRIYGETDETAEWWEWIAERCARLDDVSGAIEAWEAVLRIRTKLHGAGHWMATDARVAIRRLEHLWDLEYEKLEQLQLARRLSSKSDRLSQRGEFRLAAAANQKALEIFRSILGVECLDTANSLNSLALKYFKIGDYAAAEPLYQEALAAFKKVLGEKHPSTATTLSNLALLYTSKGDYKKAAALHRQALGVREEALGEEHSSTAHSVFDLASMYELMGDIAKAEPLHRQALNIRQHVLGEAHPSTIASMNALALLFESKGELLKAEQLQKQALELTRKHFGEQHQNLATILDNLAGTYVSMSQYAKAESLHHEALAIRRKVLGDAHSDTAVSLDNIGLLYQAMGEFVKAEEFHKQALEIRKQVYGEEDLSTSTTLNNLAQLYQSKADYEQAETLLQKSLQIKLKVLGEHHPDTATALMNLAALYHAMADNARAEPLYRRSLEIRHAVLGEEHPHTFGGVQNLAMFLTSIGEYAKAEPLLLKSIDISRRVYGEDHRHTAAVLSNLGEFYRLTGNFARAKDHYRQALHITEITTGKEHPDYAIVLSNLATLLITMGDYAEAEPLLKNAVQLFETAYGRQHPATATSLNALSVMYRAAGDYEQAVPVAERALKINEQALGKSHPKYLIVLNNLSEIYMGMGDYSRAEPLLREALETCGKTLGKQHPDFAAHLSSLATLHITLGDHAQAKQLLQQAVEIYGDQHPNSASALNSLAELYRSNGELSRAKALYYRALEVSRKLVGEEHAERASFLNNLALIYQDTGEFARAEQLYQTAFEICSTTVGADHALAAQVLMNMATLHDQWQDLARAEPEFEKALALMSRHVERAAVAQSERQQLLMTAAFRPNLDRYLSFVTSNDRSQESAYRQLLAWKGMVWARQRAVRAVADQPDLERDFRELQGVTGQLARLAVQTPTGKQGELPLSQIQTLSRKKERLERTLAGKSRDFREATEPVSLEGVMDAIPDDCVLVDFLEYWHWVRPKKEGDKTTLKRRLAAFVIVKDRPVRLVDLPDADSVSEAIEIWRLAFGRTNKSAEAAQWLRKHVWLPIEQCAARQDQSGKTAGSKNPVFLVSPDGVLNVFPFAALPGGRPNTYLLEEVAIAVVPASRLLPFLVDDTSPPKKTAGNMLVLGDVDYNDGAVKLAVNRPKKKFGRAPQEEGELFPELAGTSGEISTIQITYQDVFGLDGITTLKRRQATEEALRRESQRHKYLHLATHGFFAADRFRSALQRDIKDLRPVGELLTNQALWGYHPGLLSGIALAGVNRPHPDEDDGILTAEEVSALDLRGVQLAVLSACETGLGQAAGGEGLLGLQRAFQVAGARTVIASLWKVDDVATRDLMERFYDNLWNKDMGKLEALREAQLWMLKDRGPRGLTELDDEEEARKRLPPYYWAAFVLSGDWR